MNLQCTSPNLEDYLVELPALDFSHPLVQAKSDELFTAYPSEISKVQRAFCFVRDRIDHSWDIQGKQNTCKASEVLQHQEGICYAKTHLLAALLRSQGVPTGFCYQRLTLFDTAEQGYCIHALNAVFLSDQQTWIRLDARGNKPGINAQFSGGKEQLAFTVREELDEKDYPFIFAKPHPKILNTLTSYADPIDMCRSGLPNEL
ncbi:MULTISPECIES: transglutaminase-like domain-containing protein [Gracilibacillus]|uniref:transglutaminase-like domain-containing protein n=1 Tax=Gracilibacillus TaxID=74385 RepID=UPI00082456DE|nr:MULTISPECIES: transglutaminase family protein [Gracilibacillus]